MEAQIIDGKELAKEHRWFLKNEIEKNNYNPKLAIILAGDNPSSLIYVKGKQKAAAEIGMQTELFTLPENISEDELSALICNLNTNPEINGIIVQLPLPRHINSAKITCMIAPEKDVDGFGPQQKWLLEHDEAAALASATPKGIIHMLEKIGKSLTSRNAVVVGRSHIVGRPMSVMLLNRDCTVTTAHSKTKNLVDITRQADILIVACGCPKLITADMVKEGAIVIDVGITRVNDKLCGDVDFDSVKHKAGYISPVPGGVGPMTIAMLLDNTLTAYKKQKAALKNL